MVFDMPLHKVSHDIPLGKKTKYKFDVIRWSKLAETPGC